MTEAQRPHQAEVGTAAAGALRLPRPPGAIRRFWAGHPWLADSLIAAAYALIVLPGSLQAPAGFSAALVSVAAVLFRRRAPLWMLGVTLLCLLVGMPLGGGPLAAGVCLLLYAVAVYASVRAAWLGFGASMLVLIGATVLTSAAHPVVAAQNTVWALAILVGALVGVNIGNRKRYLQALIERAAQLARERDQQAQLAAAAERSRIARDMHDIVSHSLTVMITLAEGSAAIAQSSPERSEQAMRTVAETGRHALADMRRMLGVLADAETPGADAGTEPQPSASDLAGLVARFRAAGLPVRCTVNGDAPADSALQLTVFRVVQEALTNVLRHAPGAAVVEVAVDFRGPVQVTVENSPDPHPAASPATHGSGRGLIGLRERVALYGGGLQAGPTPQGGWRVAAEMRNEEETR